MTASCFHLFPKMYVIFIFMLCDFFPANTIMSPTVPRPRPSPLTNRKLLSVFKGYRKNTIKMEDVSTLGERYMKKETSIRYNFMIFLPLSGIYLKPSISPPYSKPISNNLLATNIFEHTTKTYSMLLLPLRMKLS